MIWYSQFVYFLQQTVFIASNISTEDAEKDLKEDTLMMAFIEAENVVEFIFLKFSTKQC